MTVKAIVDIDVVSIYTGEIFKTYSQVWLGEFDKIYNETAEEYTINKVERDGDRRTVQA